MLTRVFPPELVDEVVVGCGRLEQRSRLLPARVVVYFVLAMCLFSGQGYEEVARLLTQGLERVRRWEKPWRVPTTAAIGRARRRLGPEPLKVLFARVCRPVAVGPPVAAVLAGDRKRRECGERGAGLVLAWSGCDLSVRRAAGFPARGPGRRRPRPGGARGVGAPRPAARRYGPGHRLRPGH
ncbi:transposase domain-containing protein [Streptomyces sp. NPDC056230]|uniref:transposase domain-containing protein n=1 Tax=Streptomyces sp. NPDC056230 TaxID=3345754 RepID=UPI0035E0A722